MRICWVAKPSVSLRDLRGVIWIATIPWIEFSFLSKAISRRVSWSRRWRMLKGPSWLGGIFHRFDGTVKSNSCKSVFLDWGRLWSETILRTCKVSDLGGLRGISSGRCVLHLCIQARSRELTRVAYRRGIVVPWSWTWMRRKAAISRASLGIISRQISCCILAMFLGR